MTQSNEPTIEQMNEAIGIFMGGKWEIKKIAGRNHRRFYYSDIPFAYVKNTSSLNYHKSWDELRPVIDKISEYILVHPEQVRLVIEMKIVVNIQAAHDRVYQFCKWFNQQKQKDGE